MLSEDSNNQGGTPISDAEFYYDKENVFGYYPELLQCAKDRLMFLDPKRAAKYQTRERAPVSYEEQLKVEQELADWTLEIKEKEKELKELPAKSKQNAVAGGNNLLKRTQAEEIKVKGNDCLKAGEFEEAISFYDASLKLMVQSHVLNNRSLAHYKLKRYGKAESDANESLALNSSADNVKAYLRRGMALKAQGKYFEAIEDFIRALEFDPHNQLFQSLRRETELKYLEVEGVRAKTLPSGCGEEAKAKQLKLRAENNGFQRIPIIEEVTDEDNVNDDEGQKEKEEEEDWRNGPKIVEISEEEAQKVMNEIKRDQKVKAAPFVEPTIEPVTSNPKIVELKSEEQDGVEARTENDEKDEFVPLNITVIEEEEDDSRVIEEKPNIIHEESEDLKLTLPSTISELEMTLKRLAKEKPIPVIAKWILSIDPEPLAKLLQSGPLMNDVIFNTLLDTVSYANDQKSLADESVKNLTAHLMALTSNSRFKLLLRLSSSSSLNQLRNFLDTRVNDEAIRLQIKSHFKL